VFYGFSAGDAKILRSMIKESSAASTQTGRTEC